MYGNVSYQGGMAGSGAPGGNAGNSLALLMQRLMAGRGGGQTQYGSPEGEMAMARMLGLDGAGVGMQRDPRMMGRGMAGPPQMAGGAMGGGGMMAGMQPRPMGMGLGGGVQANTAMPTGQPQQLNPSAVDPRKLAMMRARMGQM